MFVKSLFYRKIFQNFIFIQKSPKKKIFFVNKFSKVVRLKKNCLLICNKFDFDIKFLNFQKINF